MQFKIEGQRIKANPKYNLENRLLLDKIDFKKGTVMIRGKEYPLKDANLPTIDPKDPYRLTDEERRVMENLQASILRSDKLQTHIKYLFSHGALYKVLNNILMFHGCIPVDEDGEFEYVDYLDQPYKGKELFDVLDREVRKAYFSSDRNEKNGTEGDIMLSLIHI